MVAETPAPPRKIATIDIQAWVDPEGVAWYLAFCPACGVELSKGCLGRVFTTPEGLAAEILHPLRCLECDAPLLPVPPAHRIIRATVVPT